jgi:acyl-CoA thioester hydrolase
MSKHSSPGTHENAPETSTASPHHDALIRVRYAETDQMGVVYYGNYYTWFEVGRVELCRALGFSYRQMEKEDDSFIVVAESKCRYCRPAKFDDQLRVRTRVAELQRRTIRFAYEIFRDPANELIATGETLHVICDSLGRPKSLPEKYRHFFATQDRPKDNHASGSHSSHDKRPGHDDNHGSHSSKK